MEKNKEITKEQIAVMQAYVDGAIIEYYPLWHIHPKWVVNCCPSWNWAHFAYRVAELEKPEDK